MSIAPVAHRYAKALLELGAEQNNVDAMVNETKTVADVISSSHELWLALSSPVVSPSARKAIMGEIAQKLGVSPIVRNAVLLITDHGRAAHLPRIAAALQDLADERAGKLRAEVTSAMALSDAQAQKLTTALEKLTGRKIALVRKVDPTLIGGVVTRIGDKLYDGSIKTRLAELRSSLLPS